MATKTIEGVRKGDSFNIVNLDLIRVVPGFNARENFPSDEIESLANAILAVGQTTPVLVRKRKGEGCFDLVDGERRLRAVQLLRSEGHEIYLKAVPFSGTDEEMALAMAAANLDREGFSPIEESNIVKRFAKWGWSDQEIAQRLGKSIGWVTTRRKFGEGASLALKDAVKGTNGKSVRFDIAADIAATIPELEQAAVLDTIVQAAQEAAQEATAATGSKIRPNVRRVANEVLAARKGKEAKPGATGKLGIKELRGVRDEFLARLAGHEEEYLFTAEEMAAVFMLASGEVNLKEFWKMVRAGIKGMLDEVPAWFTNAEMPKPKKRERSSTKEE